MLDDIGADYDPSGIGVSKLDRVLRSRTGKWTILTCNLTLAHIAGSLDTRIASFLIRDNNMVCEINAPDYALRKWIQFLWKNFATPSLNEMALRRVRFINEFGMAATMVW